MAVKIFLSVSLLFWLLLFYSDCGPQGVNASPLSKTFANRLDALKSLHPKKTSVIKHTLSDDQILDPKVIQLVELSYGGIDFPDRPGSNIEVSASYSGGWTIASLYANIDWIGSLENIVLTGGPDQDNWGVTLEAPEGLLAVQHTIIVTLYRVIPNKTTATVKADSIPVEQIFRFDDAELIVKAPPEIRQEISYSRQQKKK